jgi:molybdate transport system ATP-binding protein
MWDVHVHKRLRHGRSVFTLDVGFASGQRHLVLLGPSGAGKTQTLRAVAGISRPDHGHVAVDGRLLFDSARHVNLPPRARALGYVFQDYALFPHLTLRQNVAFARRRGAFNPSRTVRDEEAERWIRAFHLEGVADHYPHQISGGQRQRTALARALVNQPRALLLDEPFAALDPALRSHLRRELRALQDDLGLPTLLITHDPEDAALLGREVVSVRAGHAAAPAGSQAVE